MSPYISEIYLLQTFFGTEISFINLMLSEGKKNRVLEETENVLIDENMPDIFWGGKSWYEQRTNFH